MPPKKGKAAAAGAAAKPILGRPTNNVSMGIVGLPNIGKSTFFNLMCNMSVAAENYPFCTIDPTDARVPVPDDRFDWLVDHFKPKSEVPAVLSTTDIAGLVKGAAEGKGLGNAFLSHIAAVDGIFHLCRGFPGEKVGHVEGSVDPVRDLEIIHRELLLKDIAALRTYITKNARNVGRNLGGKTAKAEFMVCVKALNWVLHGEFTGSADEWAAGMMDVSKKAAATAAEDTEAEAESEEAEAKPLGRDIRAAPWAAEDIDTVNKFQLLTAKPMVYLINLSMKQYTTQKCKWIAPVKEFIKARGCGEKLVPFSAAFEQKFVEMEATAERDAWIKEVGVKTMIPKIIKAGYKALHLVHFFTCGADEVKAWTVRANSTAPKAAGVIHTDFEKGFICAEVQKYSDLHELGTEAAVKSAGKLRTEGKTYVVEDADIMFFKFNVRQPHPPPGAMRSAVAALAVAALWASASAQSSMMPRVTFAVALTGKARDAAMPDLNHVITSVASEGQSGQSSAEDLCGQLKNLPLAAQYQLDGFFATCQLAFERAIATERASAMNLDPKFYTGLSDLTLALSQKQVTMDAIAQAVAKNPAKLNSVQRLMQRHAAAGDVCQVGFGGGKHALLALQTMPNAKVYAFEGEESTVTVPAHDFVDAAHPDRLTLYLGDPAILVPRFITMHPNTYCSAILIDGAIDDFALRDAMVDLREVAHAGPSGHFVAITVPNDVLSAATLAVSLQSAVNRGDFVIDAVTRGELSTTLSAVQSMEEGEFFADSLVVGHFTEFKA